MNRALVREIDRIMSDPWEFQARLFLRDKRGRNVPLVLRDEQRQLFQALILHQLVLVLKSRQIGSTTICIAYWVWRAVAEHHAFHIIIVTHEQRSVGRVIAMVKAFIECLPEAIRPKFIKDNAQEIVIRTVRGVECAFRAVMAGGRGQGRSWDYRAAHLTEAAFYPQGSAALAGAAVDEDVYASILATLPQPEEDPDMRVVVESTANGPVGLYHRLVRNAIDSPEWSFLFFPWFKFVQYARPVPPLFEPTPEELALLAKHEPDGMTMQNIVYRRWKVVEQGIGLQRFRKEYPSTWMEPFMLATGTWFDHFILNDLLARVQREHRGLVEGHRQYRPYDPKKRYFGGADPAGGTERDSGVLQVFSEDLDQVYVFSSNAKGYGPHMLADEAGRIGAKYGNCVWLPEMGNKYGKAFEARALSIGLPLWSDDKGKPWVTNDKTKAMVYDYARKMINDGLANIHDERTISEAALVREWEDGTIGADDADEDQHDDHPMAMALALWNARLAYTNPTGPSKPMTMAQRRSRDILNR